MSNTVPLTSWNNVTPASLGLDDAVHFEPSGLTVYTDGGDPWIFVVGDSGKLAKAKLNHCRAGQPSETSWHGPYVPPLSAIPVQPQGTGFKPNDFECVSFAKGNVMVGVEGDRPGTVDGQSVTSLPYIARLDQSNDSSNQVGTFTGSSWELTDCLSSTASANAGMEALTFIPNGSFPASWSNGGHYDGVFVMATQSQTQTAYVYCLADGGGNSGITSTPVSATEDGLGTNTNSPGGGVLTIPLPGALATGSSDPKISEMFFDVGRGYLWVLYDGGASSDYLQALELDSSSGALSETWSDVVPWMGVEGMAVDGNDLYLAIDNNDSSDGVYLLAGFMNQITFTS